MKVITRAAEMEAERAALKGRVGLVPTMGALHEGHLSLVRRARADCDQLVVSVFVNPTQFGPKEDFAAYPRDLDRDLLLLEAEGVDVVFAPTAEEIYPPGFNDWVEVNGPLSERLEGEFRPGHLRGVTTVVARLFRIVRPQSAYFGEKDAQQLRVVRRMAQEQRLPVEVIGLPTVREPDGLAMSSRNSYLSPEERKAALVMPRALQLGRRLVEDEGVRDASAVRRAVEDLIRGEPLASIDYVAVAGCETLEELTEIDRPALLLLAVRIGATRLIDNVALTPRSPCRQGDAPGREPVEG
ncbi:MAG: pantoate--beta-alanine ligase [Dehalococcoidia bacterium]|nr:pantoate--beta-alanine ligase [Dehalococcoidia bacterium]